MVKQRTGVSGDVWHGVNAGVWRGAYGGMAKAIEAHHLELVSKPYERRRHRNNILAASMKAVAAA